MAGTGLRYERLEDGKIWRRYEVSTNETVEVWSPWKFFEDFEHDGAVAGDSLAMGGPWAKVDTNGSAAVQLAANAAEIINGGWEMVIDATNVAEQVILYFGDKLRVPVLTASHTAAAPDGRGTQIEMRVKFTTASMAAMYAWWGLATAHNSTADSIAENAWFQLAGSLVCKCESDDATTDNDDVSTGTTLVTATWYIFRIDLSDPEDIKFYIDGTRVCSGTTFTMTGTTTALASLAMQPYFRMDKTPAGTGAVTMNVDYVRIWSCRYGE